MKATINTIDHMQWVKHSPSLQTGIILLHCVLELEALSLCNMPFLPYFSHCVHNAICHICNMPEKSVSTCHVPPLHLGHVFIIHCISCFILVSVTYPLIQILVDPLLCFPLLCWRLAGWSPLTTIPMLMCSCWKSLKPKLLLTALPWQSIYYACLDFLLSVLLAFLSLALLVLLACLSAELCTETRLPQYSFWFFKPDFCLELCFWPLALCQSSHTSKP